MNRSLACALAGAAFSLPAVAADNVLDEEIVVTGVRMEQPLVVETDPKLPRQPLPAHDGADYLKAVPGFSVIRKGGTDGDPVFRGMAASRVNMLMDGEVILGGCGMRMDPPTAYVFPASYDRIVVVKGPQSVIHGPGNSAATVSFEREPPAFEAADYAFAGSATAASFGRSDLAADLSFGTRSYYARMTGTRAESSDYDDGDGNSVHSAYERWSGSLALGLRPAEGAWVELSGTLSDGEAAYADRAMDGAAFDRENLSLRFALDGLAPWLRRVEGLAYYNYVDHVMDNFSLREFAPSPMMPAKSVSNPDRRTEGARLALELTPLAGWAGTVGLDAQRNDHSVRSTMNEDMRPYRSLDRDDDGRLRQWGAFGEFTRTLAAGHRVVFGARADHWWAEDERESLPVGMMGAIPNPTAGVERETTLASGFARYEHALARSTVYTGAGYVERFPDYWELIGNRREAVDSLSAFNARPERTAQLDAGIVFHAERISFSLSAFASRIDDYLLIESNYVKGMRVTSVTRNVDAQTMGVEADLGVTLAPGLRATGTLAWVHGENESDDRPLAQLPPLELRAGLDWQRGAWSVGALLRLVSSQDRVAVDQGNVVGQDIGPSTGFTVLSLNAGYRGWNGLRLNVGVDNLLDEAYAEHISRAGAMVAGFEQTTRVNEPGRTLWVSLSADL